MSKVLLAALLVLAMAYSDPTEAGGCRYWKDVSQANIQSGFSGQMRTLRSICKSWQQKGYETKISYVRNYGRNPYYKCRVGYICQGNGGNRRSR